MIRNHTIRHIDAIYIIFTELARVRPHACDLLDPGEKWSKDVCVIIRSYTLNGCDKAFKAHAGVNVFGGKRLQGTVILAIELDKDIVPDLHNERVVFIDKVGGITTTYMIIMNLAE